MSVPNDLRALEELLEILEVDDETPAMKIERLYDAVFSRKESGARVLNFTPVADWKTPFLIRALKSIREIAILYVKDFFDPRELPVTHYRKQKQLAIHLDEQFQRLLRESVIRSGKEKLREEDGTSAKDSFLDKPILFLKEEARAKHFPKEKKGGGISLTALRDRFEQKLSAKGEALQALLGKESDDLLAKDLASRF